MFRVRIKTADRPQKPRDVIDEFIGLMRACSIAHNLGEELSDIIDAR